MTTWPSLAVIVPAYRQAPYIHACLDSIARQAYPGELEVIVVDDGSDDDGAAIAAAHPLRPRVIVQANAGVSGARNRGFAESTAQLIAYLDADDKWLPGKLERQVRAHIDAGRPALSFTRYQRVTPDGAVAQHAPHHPALALEPTPRRLITQNFIGTSTAIAHRDCIAAAGGFPATHGLLRAGQDYALWLRVAARFPLLYIPEILTDYTVHPTNRVGTDPLKHHMGGVSALRALEAWEPGVIRRLTGLPLVAVLALRRAKLVKDLAWRRAEYPADVWRRALTMRRDL